MLSGKRIGLRARSETDVPVLHAELYDDVATTMRADSRPWRPIPLGASSPYAIAEPVDTSSPFSVVELATGELIGEAVLWGIDLHNRFGHVGMSLRPAFRGQGFAADVVRTMCYYGFAVRGLHRLQLETLADNDAMIRTADRCGFVREGQTRRSAFVAGEFLDEVIMGLLAEDWRASNA
jgi:RimJ/RimL family protein N-acetyltransferase